MTAMSTSLTQFNDQGNARTYTRSGHSVAFPHLVLQKRRVPSGKSTVAEDTITVLNGTSDAADLPIAERVSMTVTVRRPINGKSADVANALSVLRDIVASDEFAATVDTQNYLK